MPTLLIMLLEKEHLLVKSPTGEYYTNPFFLFSCYEHSVKKIPIGKISHAPIKKEYDRLWVNLGLGVIWK